MNETGTVPGSTRDDLELQLIANAIRQDIVVELEAAGSGHPGGSLSAADILTVLWFSGVMRYDPDDPVAPWRDRMVLSKGHAAPALYAVFHQLGWVDDEELLTLRKLGSRLQGHPDSNLIDALDVCSGSLGQGLSVSCGIALGFRLDAKARSMEPWQASHVWCVLGDGELQEGSNWESLMFAAHRGLDNLTVLVDLNNLQIDGHVTDVNSLGDLDGKLAAFGWNVLRADGHDVTGLRESCEQALRHKGEPTAIICETIKGKGVSFMEDVASWHGVAPDADQAAQALEELRAERARLEKGAHHGE